VTVKARETPQTSTAVFGSIDLYGTLRCSHISQTQGRRARARVKEKIKMENAHGFKDLIITYVQAGTTVD